jgi:hypothetical protein
MAANCSVHRVTWLIRFASNSTLMVSPTSKTLIPLNVAQKDPIIRQRSQGILRNSLTPDPYFHHLECAHRSLESDEVEPWVFDAMKALDTGDTNPGMQEVGDIKRHKALRLRCFWSEVPTMSDLGLLSIGSAAEMLLFPRCFWTKVQGRT